VMPWTWVAFLIGGLSLAGIAPMAGFWSKDEILGAAWAGSDWESNLVFWLGLVAAIMTAFYIFRALFMTFEGEYRGGAAADPNAPDPGTGGHGSSEPHESPKSMVWPIVLLALATAAVGWLVNPLTDFGFIPMHWFSEFITIGPSHELIEVHHTEVESFNRVLALVTSVLAVAAIALAYLMYVSKTISPDAVVGPVRRLYEVVVRKYYFDDLYEDVLTRNLFYSKLAFSLDWLDTNLVDGIVRTADRAGRNVGRAMAQLQNGQLQGYGTIISAGVLVIFGIYLVFR